jgi:hypothetical protein
MPLQRPLFDEETSTGLEAAILELASGDTEERGAIFTRREVVEFVLDLAGYTADQPLHRKTLLEPSVGVGDFLLPAVERLLRAYAAAGAKRGDDFDALTRSVRAVEIHRLSLASMRQALEPVLKGAGFDKRERSILLGAWLVEGDFLLAPLPWSFDFVVGNPPYVRQELIPDALLAEYRRRYVTLYDRADIYIPFIERSLSLLAPGGAVAFICADRWMKNKYGGPLRRMISRGYRLKFFVDMVDTPAFLSDVIAYPAITVITNESGDTTRIAYRPEISARVLTALAKGFHATETPLAGQVKEIHGVTKGDAPWVLSASDQVSILRRLETTFPALEDARCKVGIGVATGADQVFIAPFEELDVEDDRKLPLVMTRDIIDGSVKWRGFGVINPFHDEGGLVSLADYPRLARYLETHGEAIKARHVSKKNPAGWYRTIDRITPSLASRPKLLIPDIKGAAHVVLEEGRLYPHHNLYYVTSAEWDLRALRAVLLSGITRLFISTYSTKMRGGYLRYQAQYLRRIRLPLWSSLSSATQEALRSAGESGDAIACDEAAFIAYRLTTPEREALQINQDCVAHGT